MKELMDIEIELDEETIESIEHHCGRKLTSEELSKVIAAIVAEELRGDNDWKEWLDDLGKDE